MSRRDTIIIAVLVNAGLLLVLFATAMRSKDKPAAETKEIVIAAPQATESPVLEMPSPLASTASPQIDGQMPPTNNSEMGLPQDMLMADNLNDTSSETMLFSEELECPTSSVEVLSKDATPKEAPLAAPQVAKAPAPASAPQKVEVKLDAQVVTVTVKKGDFLERIAKTNKSTVAAIMKENKMTSTQLKIGQVLKVPVVDKAGAAKTEVASNKAAPAKSEEFYVVKEGDSPWLIATRNHLKLEDLMRLNSMDEQKARKLRPGDRLRIR